MYMHVYLNVYLTNWLALFTNCPVSQLVSQPRLFGQSLSYQLAVDFLPYATRINATDVRRAESPKCTRPSHCSLQWQCIGQWTHFGAPKTIYCHYTRICMQMLLNANCCYCCELTVLNLLHELTAVHNNDCVEVNDPFL